MSDLENQSNEEEITTHLEETESLKDDGLDEVELEEPPVGLEIKSIEQPPAEQLSSESETYIEGAMDEDDNIQLLVNSFEPTKTVTMNDSPFVASNKKIDPNKHLAFMMTGLEELEEIVTKRGFDFNDQGQDKDLAARALRLKNIIGTLSDSLQAVYYRDINKREGADWGQGVLHNDVMVRAGKAKLKADADPVMRIRNEMGLGSLVQIPLWNSGIWVTLKTPTDGELLELDQRMGLEKVTLGRGSNGLIFSSAEIYTKSHLVDFILDHLYTATIDSKEPDILKRVILDTDYPQLVWGMAMAIYPAGYPLMQPCVANPETCDHVVEALINLSRISWIDRSRLSTSQKVHMLNRTKANSLDKIEAYQKEFSTQSRGQVEVHPNVKLRLRVPTLAEAQTIGYEWVEDILNTTQQAFGLRMADNTREQYIQRQALMTSLRQYSHWFDAVIRSADGEEEIIDDRKAVNELISMMSSNEDMTKSIYKAVRDYIDAVSISVIALPKWKCPKCQGEPSEEYLKHPKLIPLDVVQVFFTLRDQKVTGKLVAEMNRVV